MMGGRLTNELLMHSEKNQRQKFCQDATRRLSPDSFATIVPAASKSGPENSWSLVEAT
jgi:hypothetical protein